MGHKGAEGAPEPPVTAVPARHAVVTYPGRCQVCNCFGTLEQRWPSTLPARYVDLCGTCRELDDTEIASRLPPWRRDGAVV